MINIIQYRQMTDEQRAEVDQKIFVQLCWHASNGWGITLSEKKTAKELQISYPLVLRVASTKRFKEFYNQRSFQMNRKSYGVLC